ncbi:hypothetical protein [Pseudofulvibacter geojedonensis]|uniref:Uncharacterized protein n=1 Tax=Pseudofulvibacter geojedonensis TaxID=1123758 RepID=A0ABW3HZU5_9FLAO
MDYQFKISHVFLVVFLVVAIITFFITVIHKMTLKELTKNDKFKSGSWHGGIFFANPVLFIDEVNDNEINQVIIKHNKAVKYMYINVINLLVCIILMITK